MPCAIWPIAFAGAMCFCSEIGWHAFSGQHAWKKCSKKLLEGLFSTTGLNKVNQICFAGFLFEKVYKLTLYIFQIQKGGQP